MTVDVRGATKHAEKIATYSLLSSYPITTRSLLSHNWGFFCPGLTANSCSLPP
jgi:hypothetical protein